MVQIFYIFTDFLCLLILSITESGILKSPRMTVDLFVSPFLFPV